jgi:DNA-binding MarR family transcriptional regulator
MTPQSTASDDRAAGDHQAVLEAQAARVWAVMRDLTARYPSTAELRAALALGRGSGRVKAVLRLAAGPLSLSELAEAVSVDAPYATLIVDSLEERGLVERRPDPADRRRKLVALTAHGNEATERVVQIERQPPPGFAALTAEELDILDQLLSRVAASS